MRGKQGRDRDSFKEAVTGEEREKRKKKSRIIYLLRKASQIGKWVETRRSDDIHRFVYL